jgi:hypothetical protein
MLPSRQLSQRLVPTFRSSLVAHTATKNERNACLPL